MQNALRDPRPILLSNIDITGSRVEFSNTPIVLLCGGLVPIKERPEDDDPQVSSLRDAISRADKNYEMFRPEEITSWQNDAVFKNLMNFEADLASICALVVIILESAGSLVELGAFSQLPDFSKKIIAVHSSHFRKDSFINLGIFRHIAEDHESCVKSYPWDINDPSSITTEIVDDLISDIKVELDELPQSQVLNASQSSHVIVLICGIIEYFAALKEHEIFDYLMLIGVEITRSRLKSKLFLLEKFRLIKVEEYSDSTFYMRSKEPYHRLRLKLKDETFPDVFRFKMECIKFYNNNDKQRHRVRAIAKAGGGPQL